MKGSKGECSEARRFKGRASRGGEMGGRRWLAATGDAVEWRRSSAAAAASAAFLALLLGEPETIVTPVLTAAVMALKAACNSYSHAAAALVPHREYYLQAALDERQERRGTDTPGLRESGGRAVVVDLVILLQYSYAGRGQPPSTSSASRVCFVGRMSSGLSTVRPK